MSIVYVCFCKQLYAQFSTFFHLQKLEKAECDAIAEMAACSFFNKKQEVQRLTAYLVLHIDKREGQFFSKEKVFEAVFPKQSFDDTKLRLAMSHTLKLVERFLAIRQMEADDSDREIYLLQALRSRGMDKRFDKKIKAFKSRLEAYPNRDAKWNRDSHALANEELQEVSSRRRSAKVELRPLHDHLTIYYLSEMLRNACSALTHQSISAQVYDMDLLAQVLRLAEEFGMEGRPAIAIYYHASQAMMKPEEPEHFENWKTCLADSASFFTDAELRGIYLLGINYCIRRMNRGGQVFIREAFDLYRSALEKNLLAENGYLTSFTFKNIIRIGTALGEDEWTDDFFEKYQTQIHPKERATVVKYNAAFLHFRRGEYELAMPLLQQVDFPDTLNNLDARRMLLLSYFELNEMQALDSLMHSFGTYLRRQKDLGYHREMYLNLIRFLRQLTELPPGNEKALEKLKTKVKAASPLAEKEWLLAKMK